MALVFFILLHMKKKHLVIQIRVLGVLAFFAPMENN
jgi:hypothetical protein